MAEVRAREPKVHCSSSNGEMDCYLGSIKRGHLYTDFYFENGRSSMTAVTRITCLWSISIVLPATFSLPK